MKNRIRTALNRELRDVRVSADLKDRILAEAAGDRFPLRKRQFPLAPLAAAAALMLLVALAAGILSMRTVRPDRRNQVFSDGGQDWVWVSESDALYHARKDCSDIENPTRMLLADAKAAGRTACRACIAVTRSSASPKPEASVEPTAAPTPVPEMPGDTQPEVNYDVLPPEAELPVPEESDLPEESDANGAATSSALDEELPGSEQFDSSGDDMLSNGQTNGAQVIVDENFFDLNLTHTSEIREGELLGLPDGMVWATDKGMYYHWEERCSGMTGASQIEESLAQERGQTPCPICQPVEIAEDAVWLGDDAAYFHADEYCSGMTDAKPVSIDKAILSGRTPCPTCTEESYVFATPNGSYYHTAKNCSSMQNAYTMTLTEAVLMGKERCSICGDSNPVYATTGGTYYHSIDECSGMRGAMMISEQEAIGRGKEYCPVCMPLLEDAMSSEVTFTLRAAQHGQYLMVEAEPAHSIAWLSSWLKSTDPVHVDTTSKDFAETMSMLSDSMSASELDGFVARLNGGDVRGVSVVTYTVTPQQMGTADGTVDFADAMKSLVFDDPASQIQLIDCADADPAETVTLSISAEVVNYLVLPDGSCLSTASMIDLEPLSLLADGERAVLTAKQSRSRQNGMIQATFCAHSVDGEVRTEVLDLADVRSNVAIDGAELVLVTVADRQFARVILPEWRQALDDGDQVVDSMEILSGDQPLALQPVDYVRGYGGKAAVMLVDGPYDPDEIVLSFEKAGVAHSVVGSVMTVE